MNRNTTIRHQKNVNPSNMNEPFFYIDGHYPLDTIYHQIIGRPNTRREMGDFPNNIKKWFWAHEGENDAESWRCLVQLENGYYAYYEAYCDYTGFDCQGGMDLFIDKKYDVLINLAMSNADYDLYIEETQ